MLSSQEQLLSSTRQQVELAEKDLRATSARELQLCSELDELQERADAATSVAQRLREVEASLKAVQMERASLSAALGPYQKLSPDGARVALERVFLTLKETVVKAPAHMTPVQAFEQLRLSLKDMLEPLRAPLSAPEPEAPTEEALPGSPAARFVFCGLCGELLRVRATPPFVSPHACSTPRCQAHAGLALLWLLRLSAARAGRRG